MNWDYLAGFFDGEGSICFAAGKANKEHVVYRLAFTLSNNRREVLDLACAFLGFGRVYRRARKEGRHRPSWDYKATGHGLLPALRELEPRLLIKRPQVLLAIQFIEHRAAGARTRPYSEADYQFIQEMRRLNDRAPGKGKPLRKLPDGCNSA